jgi:pimeloyl-ACP methyl ester carboxylesterase
MKKEIEFKAKDNFQLYGTFEVPEDSQSDKCVVLCHGLGVDREELGVFTKLATQLVDEGFHTFRFDFRGQGKSTTQSGLEFSVTGELKDVHGAISYLKNEGYKSFIIIAASFAGGAVALYSGGNPDGVEGLMMWNALIDYEEKINPTTERNKKAYGQAALDEIAEKGYWSKKDGFKFSKEAFDELYVLKPYESLLRFKKPILFIHGDKDEHVLYSDSMKYSKMMENAKLVTIKGAPHGFHIEEDGNKACDAATEFIKQIF